MLALDARTGRPVWAADLGVGPQSPCVVGNIVYATLNPPGTLTGRVVALRVATGARVWQAREISGIPGFLAVADGVVVCGPEFSGRPFAVGLDAATGRQLWQAETAGGGVTATGGVIVFLETRIGPGSLGPTTVTARYPRSGRIAWTRIFPGQTGGFAANGVLYAAGENGRLDAVAASSGKTLWSRDLPARIMAGAADATAVYVCDTRGQVYALRA